MKATELMIGDWVYRPDCEDRVTIILGHSICGLDRLRGIICEEELKPISLTAEILEKNGYESHSNRFALLESKYWTFKNDKGVCIELKESKNTIAIWLDYDKNVQGIYAAFPSYVHELQHALRLCGLTELADNFKVE